MYCIKSHIQFQVSPSTSEICSKNLKIGRFYPGLPYIFICVCNLAALACIVFELWSIKVAHFSTILWVGLLNRQLNHQLHLVHTCILRTVTFLLYILMTWDFFFLFQRREINLQIDTTQCTRPGRSTLKISNTWKREPWNNLRQIYLWIWGTIKFTTCDSVPYCDYPVPGQDMQESFLNLDSKIYRLTMVRR